MGSFDIPRPKKSAWERMWGWLAKSCCNLWSKILSIDERLAFALFALIMFFAIFAIVVVAKDTLVSVSVIDAPGNLILRSTTEITLVIVIIVCIIAMACVNLAIDSNLIGSNCVLFNDARGAFFALVVSSITAGVSMAFFVALLTTLSTLLHISISVYAIIAIMALALPQLSIAVQLPKYEASVICGDLTVVSIGVLAVSMGFCPSSSAGSTTAL